MMDIVINACYGGFCLSDEAMIMYAKRKGLKCFIEETSVFTKTFWTVEEDKRPVEIDWDKSSIEQRVAYNEAHRQSTIYDRDIPRNDVDLVAVVKELGEKANDRFSKLKIITIPDGIDWEIDEYDGWESVYEKHRHWG